MQASLFLAAPVVAIAGVALAIYLIQYHAFSEEELLPSLDEEGEEQRNTLPEHGSVARQVVVVGGGLAGLSAAIEAIRGGAHVSLLEKTNQLGGNSAKASSGINAVGTPAQARIQSRDTPDIFMMDTLRSGKGQCDDALVKVLVDQSASAIDFLASFGSDLSILTKCGGHTYARTHRTPPPAVGPARNVGWEIMQVLSNYLKTLPSDKIEILTDANLTSLIRQDTRVVGIRYIRNGDDVERELLSDAVILTTGGYARASDLLMQYAPSVAHLPTTNGGFAKGEGIKIAEQVGAATLHMDKVQIHPTGIVAPADPLNPTKFLAPEALRGLGGILLNQNGKRFVNELGFRDEVTTAIFNNCQPLRVYNEQAKGSVPMEVSPVVAYLVLSDAAAQGYSPLSFYRARGFVQSYNGVAELSKGLGVDRQTIEETLREYNRHHEAQRKKREIAITNEEEEQEERDEFGKTDFPSSFESDGIFHVVTVTPCIHYTMGGLKIDTLARVLQRKREEERREVGGREESGEEDGGDAGWVPIDGLYAAGEVTGGVHGANRLAGNSLLECVVFGRIGGQQSTQE